MYSHQETGLGHMSGTKRHVLFSQETCIYLITQDMAIGIVITLKLTMKDSQQKSGVIT